MSNITNLPSEQVLALRTSVNLATALKKQFFITEMFSFMNNIFQQQYEAASENDIVKIKIKPQLTAALNVTAYSKTILTLADHETAVYGSIQVPLDYALVKRFRYGTADMAFVTANLEADMLETAMEQMFITMKRTINFRLRTSPFAQNIGTAGTPLNANTFYALRELADSQGYQNKILEIRLNPSVWTSVIKIPEFQTDGGFVPVAGNQATANNSISSTKFQVGGAFNFVFIKDNTFDVPTPASDPKGVAYTDVSAVVPLRGLPIGDRAKDFPMFDRNTGINLLYQKDSEKINIGREILASLEGLYGFKELSGDINTAGVIQTAPIYTLLGGA